MKYRVLVSIKLIAILQLHEPKSDIPCTMSIKNGSSVLAIDYSINRIANQIEMFIGIEYRLQQHIQETDNKSVVISDSSFHLLHIERIPEARSITNMANIKHYKEKGHLMLVFGSWIYYVTLNYSNWNLETVRSLRSFVLIETEQRYQQCCK